MSYHNSVESYIQPQYTSLTPERKDTSTNFSQELLLFLSQYPEFSSSESHLKFLRYCFYHYINCDPISQELPIQEKLSKQVKWPKISWASLSKEKDSRN